MLLQTGLCYSPFVNVSRALLRGTVLAYFRYFFFNKTVLISSLD